MDRELLLAMSDLLDQKLKAELQPLKDEICGVKDEVAGLKGEVSALKEDVSALKEDVSSMKDRLDVLEEDVHGIKLHLENVTDKNIQLLAENYVPEIGRAHV